MKTTIKWSAIAFTAAAALAACHHKSQPDVMAPVPPASTTPSSDSNTLQPAPTPASPTEAPVPPTKPGQPMPPDGMAPQSNPPPPMPMPPTPPSPNPNP